jgi:methylisocitrate lyase
MRPDRPLADRLAGGATVLMPGVWDPLSALVAVRSGFDTLFVSGFAMSASLLGEPDHGILTQSEVAETAGRIGRRLARLDTPVDLIVDADTGYGGEANIRRTVALGHRDHLFVCARTDARGPIGLDEAISRGLAARDLGVDAVFVEAPGSVEELRAIAEGIPGVPLVANMVEGGRTPLLTPDELADLGFSLIVSPLSGLLSMSAALEASFDHLRAEGTLRDQLDSVTGFDEFVDIVTDVPRA